MRSATLAVEEADELLVPVALHVAADDGAVEHIEGLFVFPLMLFYTATKGAK
ncbi:MAG: hypothetical protein WA624_00650 [Methylocella sp.]